MTRLVYEDVVSVTSLYFAHSVVAAEADRSGNKVIFDQSKVNRERAREALVQMLAVAEGNQQDLLTNVITYGDDVLSHGLPSKTGVEFAASFLEMANDLIDSVDPIDI